MVSRTLAICWADLGEPAGSRPAERRPVLVIQADPYNSSKLATVVAAVITSNTGLAAMPGNVFLPAAAVGLPRDSVVNVTALVTLDKKDLGKQAGVAPDAFMREVSVGLRRLLGL
jgi:mRNA interferase MazF